MSTATAPYPYFNGITYNPSFFSSSSNGLTQTQANLLYLRKTTDDTATATETFSKILTTNIDTINPATSVSLFNSTTTGHIEIGANQTTGDIFVGSASSTVSFLNGLTLGNGKGITCGTTSYTPIISQLGYSNTKSTSVLTATTSSQQFCSMFGLSKGIYILFINALSSNATNASAICQIFQQSITGCNTTLDPYNIGSNGLSAVIPICFIGILNVTSNSNSIVFNCAMTPTGTIQFNNINTTAIRIA
jgi:hypothetical protein